MTLRFGIAILMLSGVAQAAELKPETLKAWDEYLGNANSHIRNRADSNSPFLWVDGAPERIRQVRAGEIAVAPLGDRSSKRVQSGLIHHWIGAVFIAGTKLDDVLAVVRSYERYKDFYNPVVMDSKMVSHAGTRDKFSVVLMNKTLFAKAALDSEFESSFVRVDSRRWYSVSDSAQVQEIQNYGQPGEHRLPANQGSGYIWRLHSVMRFEERDGGVYLEVEAMALSRDIPASLRWVVDPIVQRVSKGSLTTSLRQTQEAVAGDGLSRISKAAPAPPISTEAPAMIRSFRQ